MTQQLNKLDKIIQPTKTN